LNKPAYYFEGYGHYFNHAIEQLHEPIRSDS